MIQRTHTHWVSVLALYAAVGVAGIGEAAADTTAITRIDITVTGSPCTLRMPSQVFLGVLPRGGTYQKDFSIVVDCPPSSTQKSRTAVRTALTAQVSIGKLTEKGTHIIMVGKGGSAIFRIKENKNNTWVELDGSTRFCESDGRPASICRLVAETTTLNPGEIEAGITVTMRYIT